MNNKYVVMPLKNTVLFSGGHLEIDVDSDYEENLKKQIEENDGLAVALTLKEHNDSIKYLEDDFYHIGNLIRVEEISMKGSHYKLKIDVLERVKVNKLELISNHYIASYEVLEDIMDIDEHTEHDILDYIKKLTEERLPLNQKHVFRAQIDTDQAPVATEVVMAIGDNLL